MALTPIIANILDNQSITVEDYDDGTIAFSGFITKTTPVISTACRKILNTVGLVGGIYAARPYPMLIKSGNAVVFTVPTLYFGSRQTADQFYSDIELVRGVTFAGQIM